MCSVLKECHLRKQIICIDTFDNRKSSFLIVLYKNQKTTEIAGNNIKIFDIDFNVVFQLLDTQFYYTSVFKWFSSGSLDIVNTAFTLILSKRVHLIKINIKVGT